MHRIIVHIQRKLCTVAAWYVESEMMTDGNVERKIKSSHKK